jgi:hypothetical protein
VRTCLLRSCRASPRADRSGGSACSTSSTVVQFAAAQFGARLRLAARARTIARCGRSGQFDHGLSSMIDAPSFPSWLKEKTESVNLSTKPASSCMPNRTDRRPPPAQR